MAAIATTSAERVAFKKIPQAALFALLPAVVINLVLWFGGAAITGGQVTGIPWPAIIITNAILLIFGSVFFALLGRFTKRPFLIFTIISIVFLVIFTSGPIGAMSTPPQGATEPLNLATVVVLELQHLVAGIAAIWAFNKYPRA
jgi:Family of unknown function (DUF6069)